MGDIDKATDEIETRIKGICEEVDGIEKVGRRQSLRYYVAVCMYT